VKADFLVPAQPEPNGPPRIAFLDLAIWNDWNDRIDTMMRLS